MEENKSLSSTFPLGWYLSLEYKGTSYNENLSIFVSEGKMTKEYAVELAERLLRLLSEKKELHGGNQAH